MGAQEEQLSPHEVHQFPREDGRVGEFAARRLDGGRGSGYLDVVEAVVVEVEGGELLGGEDPE